MNFDAAARREARLHEKARIKEWHRRLDELVESAMLCSWYSELWPALR